MLKLAFLVFGGLLAGSAITVLYVWPHVGPAPPDTANTLVLTIADHLFKESRFPVLVRRDNVLADCNDTGSEGGVVLLTQEGQQAATEVVYNSGVVCVHTYLSRQQAREGQKPVIFNVRRYEIVFGELPQRAFYDDRSVGFRFPQSRDDALVAAELGDFLRRIPRYFNARTAGGLSNMVSELRSPHRAAQGFVKQVAALQPKDRFALNIPGGWFLILSVGLSTLMIPTAVPILQRLRMKAASLPAVVGASAASSAAAAGPSVATGSGGPAGAAAQDTAAAREQFIFEREEKAIRMIALLQDSITQEAGVYAANQIFAQGEEVANQAGKRGRAPRSSERVFLAGKLAELLERKHRGGRTDLHDDDD